MSSHYISYEEDETSRRLSSLLIRRCSEVKQCDFIVRAPGRVNLIGFMNKELAQEIVPLCFRRGSQQAMRSMASTQKVSGQEQRHHFRFQSPKEFFTINRS
ncbi:hypothetical protein ACTXT7_010268 [Hymenolepis weldensis]